MPAWGYYPIMLACILVILLVILSFVLNSVFQTLIACFIMMVIIYLWLKKELQPKRSGNIYALSPIELKHRFSFQSSHVDFFLLPGSKSSSFRETQILPRSLGRHQVILSSAWWEQTPTFYRTIALLYIHEFTRALNDSLLWHFWWDFRSLFGKSISVTDMQYLNKKIHKQLNKYHGLDRERIKLFELRYMPPPSSIGLTLKKMVTKS